jgi:hypothetical protein
MRTALLAGLLVCALLTPGCLTLSVYPLYTANEVVTGLPLEGTWTDAEGKDVWEIRKNGDAYAIVCTTDKTSEPVEAHLLRLGDQHFLDLTSKDTPSLAIAGHFFAKIRTSQEELQVQLMDSAWLERKARETGLASLDLPDREMVLTASTGELQRFILRHAGDPDAFGKAENLRRLR